MQKNNKNISDEVIISFCMLGVQKGLFCLFCFVYTTCQATPLKRTSLAHFSLSYHHIYINKQALIWCNYKWYAWSNAS